MKQLSQLFDEFKRIPINESNEKLYSSLLSLNQSVYKPIMEEILSGRIDIEDTRPIFSKYFQTIKSNLENNSKLKLISNKEDFRANLKNKYNGNFYEYIKETYIDNVNYSMAKNETINNFESSTGTKLSENQKNLIHIALDHTVFSDNDFYGNKNDQIYFSDRMAQV